MTKTWISFNWGIRSQTSLKNEVLEKTYGEQIWRFDCYKVNNTCWKSCDISTIITRKQVDNNKHISTIALDNIWRDGISIWQFELETNLYNSPHTQPLYTIIQYFVEYVLGLYLH